MKLADWQEVKSYEDITYHKAEGIARIAFNRPEVRNAFRPLTIDEMTEAVLDAWHDTEIGVVWITANGPSPKDGIWSFCA
ncbi:MAG: 1,4-dihydroxy-2-naphthoyl-CoA synthase, partial [Chloroflexi bacterium]